MCEVNEFFDDSLTASDFLCRWPIGEAKTSFETLDEGVRTEHSMKMHAVTDEVAFARYEREGSQLEVQKKVRRGVGNLRREKHCNVVDWL